MDNTQGTNNGDFANKTSLDGSSGAGDSVAALPCRRLTYHQKGGGGGVEGRLMSSTNSSGESDAVKKSWEDLNGFEISVDIVAVTATSK